MGKVNAESALRKEIHELRRKLEKANASDTAEVDRLKATVNQLTAEKSCLEQELSRVREDLSYSRVAIEMAEHRNEEGRANQQRMYEAIEAKTQMVSTLEGEVDKLKKETTSLRRQNTSLKKKIEGEGEIVLND